MAALPIVHAGRAAGAAAVAKVLNGDIGDPSQLLDEYPRVAEAVQSFSADLVRHASELDEDEQRWLEYTARNMDRATESAHSALQTAEAFRKVLDAVQPGAQVRDEVQKVFSGCEKILQIEVNSVQDSFEQCKREWRPALPSHDQKQKPELPPRQDAKEQDDSDEERSLDAAEDDEAAEQEDHDDMLIDEALEGVPAARSLQPRAHYEGPIVSGLAQVLELQAKRKEGEESNEWQREVTARVAQVCWFVTAVIIVLRKIMN